MDCIGDIDAEWWLPENAKLPVIQGHLGHLLHRAKIEFQSCAGLQQLPGHFDVLATNRRAGEILYAVINGIGPGHQFVKRCALRGAPSLREIYLPGTGNLQWTSYGCYFDVPGTALCVV